MFNCTCMAESDILPGTCTWRPYLWVRSMNHIWQPLLAKTWIQWTYTSYTQGYTYTHRHTHIPTKATFFVTWEGYLMAVHVYTRTEHPSTPHTCGVFLRTTCMHSAYIILMEYLILNAPLWRYSDKVWPPYTQLSLGGGEYWDKGLPIITHTL